MTTTKKAVDALIHESVQGSRVISCGAATIFVKEALMSETPPRDQIATRFWFLTQPCFPRLSLIFPYGSVGPARRSYAHTMDAELGILLWEDYE